MFLTIGNDLWNLLGLPLLSVGALAGMVSYVRHRRDAAHKTQSATADRKLSDARYRDS